jgi:hypothetical protein
MSEKVYDHHDELLIANEVSDGEMLHELNPFEIQILFPTVLVKQEDSELETFYANGRKLRSTKKDFEPYDYNRILVKGMTIDRILYLHSDMAKFNLLLIKARTENKFIVMKPGDESHVSTYYLSDKSLSIKKCSDQCVIV